MWNACLWFHTYKCIPRSRWLSSGPHRDDIKNIFQIQRFTMARWQISSWLQIRMINHGMAKDVSTKKKTPSSCNIHLMRWPILPNPLQLSITFSLMQEVKQSFRPICKFDKDHLVKFWTKKTIERQNMFSDCSPGVIPWTWVWDLGTHTKIDIRAKWKIQKNK